MGPWAHGPIGPWAHRPMGPWAHGPMGNAGIRAWFTSTKRSLWKAFWGNAGHPVPRGATLKVKRRLLERSCKPVLSYRCSRWPPQPTIARELDRVQSKMAASLLRVQRLPGEDAAIYCRRRNRFGTPTLEEGIATPPGRSCSGGFMASCGPMGPWTHGPIGPWPPLGSPSWRNQPPYCCHASLL